MTESQRKQAEGLGNAFILLIMSNPPSNESEQTLARLLFTEGYSAALKDAGALERIGDVGGKCSLPGYMCLQIAREALAKWRGKK
jgi:hypothetical protein